MNSVDKIFIKGGVELNGEIVISGSKNASLPIIAASLLTDEEVILKGVPVISDVTRMIELVSALGKRCDFTEANTLKITPNKNVMEEFLDRSFHAPMRASCLVMGPALGRRRKTVVHYPGGCVIGARPIDFHIAAFKKMGVSVEIERDKMVLNPLILRGADINFPRVSVGATQNVLMAAVFAEGETTISNAASEPEVIDLISFLNGIGAQISWIDHETIKVVPVSCLKGTVHKVIPDRIEAATYLVMAAVIGGEIKLRNVDVSKIECIIEKLLKTEAVEIENHEDYLTVRKMGKIRPLDVDTGVYPGFPTDVQPQFTTLLTLADGQSRIRETIFESRFTHVPELRKMGVQISLEKPDIISIHGNEDFKPSNYLKANDLRSGAALIIAALRAKGESTVEGACNIERGYEKLKEKLRACGALIS